MFISKFNKKINVFDNKAIVKCQGYVTIVRCGDSPIWNFEEKVNMAHAQDSREVFVKLEVAYDLLDLDCDLEVSMLNNPDLDLVTIDLCDDVLFDDCDFKIAIENHVEESGLRGNYEFN